MRHPMLEETVAFMKAAHDGQTDKGGVAYWHHPFSVMCRVRNDYGGGLPEMHAALLHDVIEDTDHTLDDLHIIGYSPEIIEMVRLVTKLPGDGLTYQQWIRSIADSGNIGAIRVKLADIDDNKDPVRIARLPEELRGIANRYERAHLTLVQVLHRLTHMEAC